MHFGGLEDCRKDYTSPHITSGPQLGGDRHCGLAICTFHLGFSLVAWLANDLTGDIESPFEKMLVLQRYLDSEFRYDPNPETAPDAFDPVEWFLFERKAGTALDFASSLALMGRSAGVPTRLVVGWVAPKGDRRQTISADLAHVWVEAQFVIDGAPEWLEFDATPEGGAPGRAGGVELSTNNMRFSEDTSLPPDDDVAREAGRPPIGLLDNLAQAAALDPAAAGGALAEWASIDPEYAGSSMVVAAQIDSDALGKALAEAARRDPVASGKAIAKAATLNRLPRVVP